MPSAVGGSRPRLWPLPASYGAKCSRPGFPVPAPAGCLASVQRLRRGAGSAGSSKRGSDCGYWVRFFAGHGAGTSLRQHPDVPARNGRLSWEDYLPPLGPSLRSLAEKYDPVTEKRSVRTEHFHAGRMGGRGAKIFFSVIGLIRCGSTSDSQRDRSSNCCRGPVSYNPCGHLQSSAVSWHPAISP